MVGITVRGGAIDGVDSPPPWGANVRPEVPDLVILGPLPTEEEWTETSRPRFDDYDRLAEALENPATDEEALALLDVFGPKGSDSCYGVAWRILHFVETAPSWPGEPATTERGRALEARLRSADNPWVRFLWNRIKNARRSNGEAHRNHLQRS